MNQGQSLGARFELVVGVTTYGRPEDCRRLLSDTIRALEQANRLEQAFLVVVRDTSDHDYTPVLELLETLVPGRFAFYEGERWRGKTGRYATYQILFDVVRRLGAAHALLMEDDVVMAENFVAESLRTYEAVNDPEKAVLYLAKFDDDEPEGRWVKFRRKKHPELQVDEIGWFDLHAFLAGRRFFELLDWQVFRPHRWRWVGNEKRSSGVSEQFARRLLGRGSVYQMRNTLAYHGRAPSILNVEARAERPMNNFPEPE